jgi:hypothetical protein
MEGKVQAFGHIGDKGRIPVRFRSPQTVIQVSDSNRQFPFGSQLKQNMKQGDGIRSAGHACQNAIAFAEHVMAQNALLYLLQYLMGMKSHGQTHCNCGNYPPVTGGKKKPGFSSNSSSSTM